MNNNNHGIPPNKLIADKTFLCELWQQYFPQFTLPYTFLNRWVDNHRSQNEVIQAFKDTRAILIKDPNKTAQDVAAILASVMRKHAIGREKVIAQWKHGGTWWSRI